MKKIILLFSICISFFALKAKQKTNADSLKTTYEKETIYFENDPWKGLMYIKNGEKKKVGVFAKELSKEIETSSDAKMEMAIAKHQMKKGFGLTMGGATLAIASILTLPLSIPIALTGAAVGITVEFIGAGKAIKGQNHFLKSVWLYNRDVISKK